MELTRLGKLLTLVQDLTGDQDRDAWVNLSARDMVTEGVGSDKSAASRLRTKAIRDGWLEQDGSGDTDLVSALVQSKRSGNVALRVRLTAKALEALDRLEEEVRDADPRSGR